MNALRAPAALLLLLLPACRIPVPGTSVVKEGYYTTLVATFPPGAEVEADGEKVGAAPCLVDTPWRIERYRYWVTPLDPVGGILLAPIAFLMEVKGDGSFTNEMILLIGGRPGVERETGSAAIVARKPSFEEARREIAPTRSGTLQVNLKGVGKKTFVFRSDPPGAALAFDGFPTQKFTTPWQVELSFVYRGDGKPPEPVSYRVEKEGHRPFAGRVLPQSEEVVRVRLAPE